jgi:hypothetical protein
MNKLREIRLHWDDHIKEYRGEKPQVERIGMSVEFVRAIENIDYLLRYVEQLREAAVRVVTTELSEHWGHLNPESYLRMVARDMIENELYDIQNPKEEEGDDAEG